MSLESLKYDLRSVQSKIRDWQEEIDRLRSEHERTLTRINNQHESDTDSIQRRLDDAKQREPELVRELEREEERERSRKEAERK